MIQYLKQFFFPSSSYSPSEQAYIQYLYDSYPSNHTYKISGGRLKPKRKLAARYKILREYFPADMASFAEVGSSKGFFVFAASQAPTCTRSIGIDIHPYDIEVCEWLGKYLNNSRVKFAKLRLHELSEQLEAFGGPVQTVLVANTYQYLYFGSNRCKDAYLSHDLIFRHLRNVCSQRIIFNNRINLNDCQNVEQIKQANPYAISQYSEEK